MVKETAAIAAATLKAAAPASSERTCFKVVFGALGMARGIEFRVSPSRMAVLTAKTVKTHVGKCVGISPEDIIVAESPLSDEFADDTPASSMYI